LKHYEGESEMFVHYDVLPKQLNDYQWKSGRI